MLQSDSIVIVMNGMEQVSGGDVGTAGGAVIPVRAGRAHEADIPAPAQRLVHAVERGPGEVGPAGPQPLRLAPVLHGHALPRRRRPRRAPPQQQRDGHTLRGFLHHLQGHRRRARLLLLRRSIPSRRRRPVHPVHRPPRPHAILVIW
jgi:hypothetical protein